MIDAKEDPRGHDRQYREKEAEERFHQAIAMLHARQYHFAITALNRVLDLAPAMAEAYINLGFAYVGLEDYTAARDHFTKAIDMRPYQANAYWGLAVSLERFKSTKICTV